MLYRHDVEGSSIGCSTTAPSSPGPILPRPTSPGLGGHPAPSRALWLSPWSPDEGRESSRDISASSVLDLGPGY